MAHPISRPFPDPSDDDGFDLAHIFISREQQLDLFDIYLTRWQKLIFDADPDFNAPLQTVPSPHKKLQCLVVLLYGHGGFGKSTLLSHYQAIALEEQRHLTVSTIVDWEFAVEGKRALFNPPPGQEVDAPEYYRVLCSQLTPALEKRPKDFRTYQTAVKDVEQARKQASGVLASMQNDDRYATLRSLTIDALSMIIGTVAPAPVGKIVGNEKVKGAVNEGVKVGAEQIAQIHAKLRDRLGSKLADYLDASTRLGLALGHDLRLFAQNRPLVILFDTYEEVDTADRLLRIVMGAAGLRVGWVLAGRDNLWGGAEQRKRSITKEYGYKDIVPADRGLAIDFSVGGVGAFTLSDIQDYFDQVCERAHYEPSLPPLTEEHAERILDVTLGIPLAVKIAAGLSLATADVAHVTESLDSRRDIVDQMVERYLLHTRDDLDERHKLYGLALLRHSDLRLAVAAALGLSEEDAKTNYERELSRLHRRYSFIFTEKVQPSLHQEVRHFLRLQLLERRKDTEIVTLNTRLKDVHEAALQHLEAHRQYTTLEERLQDDEWIGIYLDLAQQQFWLDPVEGVRSLLPFMIAAGIYRRDLNKDAAELGTFFAPHIHAPYRNWWAWATDSLTPTTSRHSSDAAMAGLQHLVQLAEQHSPTFPPLLPASRQELEALLWWRLGEAYRDRDATKALLWYEKALTRLGIQGDLREAAAETAFERAYQLAEEKKHVECLPLLNRAIELKPDYAHAYYNRGLAYHSLKNYAHTIEDYDRAITLDPNDAHAYYGRGLAYYSLKDYARAIQDYDRAITLDPNDAITYSNRGLAYNSLKEYVLAIQDCDRAIALDPNDATAYYNRGIAYYYLKEYARAIQDYDRAITLDPNSAATYYNRGLAYISLKEYERAIQDYDRAIALDPNDAHAYYNRGTAYIFLKEHARAIQDYDRAIALDPNFAHAYHNRGMTYLWLNNRQQASADFRTISLHDPADCDAPWMAEWAGMGKQRIGQKVAERLEAIATIDPQHYVAHVCRGVALGTRGRLQEGLQELEKAILLEPEKWNAYFWKGMLAAYYHREPLRTDVAEHAIMQALEFGLPPILLTPLYWLEVDVPDAFVQYARPLLQKYGV